MRARRKDDAGDDIKAETREVTGSITTGTGTAAKAVAKTAGGGEFGMTKAQFPHDTTAGGIGTGAEAAIQNVTGETDAAMPRAAGVAVLITERGAGPGMETVTDTAAGLRIADEVKSKTPL